MLALSARLALALIAALSLLPAVHAGIEGEVTPLSNTMKVMANIKDKTAAQEFIQRQVNLSQAPADEAAKDLKVEDASCCYFATSTYAQLETGGTLNSRSIRFHTKFIEAEDIRRVLPQLMGRDVLFYEDINFVEASAPMVEWLQQNLLDGEPIMLVLGVNSPYEKEAVVGHSVNAIKVGDEVRVYDSAYDVSSSAQQFFDHGTHWYKVDLNEPVAVVRTVRDGVNYRLRARDVRLRNYWYNEERLDLRTKLSPGQLQQNFDSNQLRQQYQQQLRTAEAQCS